MAKSTRPTKKISIDASRRLNRASVMARFAHLQAYTQPQSIGGSAVFTSYLFDYIADDLQVIREELRQRGELTE